MSAWATVMYILLAIGAILDAIDYAAERDWRVSVRLAGEAVLLAWGAAVLWGN